MSPISPNAAIKAAVFEISLPGGSADFAESSAFYLTLWVIVNKFFWKVSDI